MVGARCRRPVTGRFARLCVWSIIYLASGCATDDQPGARVADTGATDRAADVIPAVDPPDAVADTELADADSDSAIDIADQPTDAADVDASPADAGTGAVHAPDATVDVGDDLSDATEDTAPADACIADCDSDACDGDACTSECVDCPPEQCVDGQCVPPEATVKWGIGEPITWNVLGASKKWDADAQIAALAPLHPELVRMWMHAGHMMTGPGAWDEAKTATYDMVIGKLVDAGYSLILMDHGVPEWMTGVTGGEAVVPCRDTTPGSTYQLFLDRYEAHWAAVVGRYPAVTHWQVFNEPNGAGFMQPAAGCDPDGFDLQERADITLDLMYRGAKGIRTSQPDATVIMPGIAPSLIEIETFMGLLYTGIDSGQWGTTDPREFFDVAAWHPYAVGQPSASWVLDNEAVRAVMVDHGDADAPVLFSEYGYTDSGDPDLWDQHADWLLEANELIEDQMPWVWGVTWFRMMDAPYYLGTPAQGEAGFGVMRAPVDGFEWKPAAYTLASIRGNQAPEDAVFALEFDDDTGYEVDAGIEAIVVGGWIYANLPDESTGLTVDGLATDASSVGVVEIYSAVTSPPTSALSLTLSFVTGTAPDWQTAEKVVVPLHKGQKPYTYLIATGDLGAWTGTITGLRISGTNSPAFTLGLDSIRLLPKYEPAACDNPAWGAVIAPAFDALVTDESFEVSLTAQDADGLSELTVRIDSMESCEFDASVSGGDVGEDATATVQLSPGTCGLEPGGHWLTLWAEDECGQRVVVDSVRIQWQPTKQTCDVTSTPTVGTWQADYTPETACTCTAGNGDCHGIYVGRVDALTGSTATVRFRKAGGGAPSLPVTYWVAAPPGDQLTCDSLTAYPFLATGTWTPAQGDLMVDVPTLGGSSGCSDTQRVGLVTGGSGGPTLKTWFTPDALLLHRECGPAVYSVAPLEASLDVQTTFTIMGSCLPQTLTAWIADCEDLTMVEVLDASATFQCTPSWTVGGKAGVVKDTPGGNNLHEFDLEVVQ